VGINALIEEEIATFLAERLLADYPQALTMRYGLDITGLDAVDVLEGIAKRRGFRVKGGEFDMEKAALAFLQDFRNGALGRISLETPASRQEMVNQPPEPSRDPMSLDAEDADIK